MSLNGTGTGTVTGNGNRKKTMIRLIIILILISLFVLVYWFFFLRNRVSTDDAYVNGYMVNVTSEISGITNAFYADNTDFVKKGALLVTFDRTDYELALEEAKTALALAVRQVVQLKEDVSQAGAEIEAQALKYQKAIFDFENRQGLVESLAVTEEDFEHAQIAMESERQFLSVYHHKMQKALSALGETTLENHPIVENAKAHLRQAFINLQRTSIFAPVDGFIAKRSVEVGKWVNPKDALMAIISLDNAWVDANFKETQMEWIRIGQTVNMISDLYGSRVPFHGKVLGITPGSGSVFSLLPPQNATGNWIKIVQRIPVRISLDKDELQKNPLLLGLSIDATVDISDQSGKFLHEIPPNGPVVTTAIYEISQDEINAMIEKIVAENQV